MQKNTYQLETKNGDLHVRKRTFAFNPDGSVRTSSLHRHVIHPGKDYSAEPRKVRRLAAALHTTEVIQKYQDQQPLDLLASEPPLVDGKIDFVEVIVREDDHAEICKRTEIIKNGDVKNQHFDPIVVPPGVPVSNAPAKVNAMIAAAHIPTVVNKYESGLAYEAAKEKLLQVTSDRDLIQRNIRAVKDTQAQLQEKLDADAGNKALIEKIVGWQVSLDDLQQREPQAVADVLQAEKDEARLLKKRDAAIQAYDDFESG